VAPGAVSEDQLARAVDAAVAVAAAHGIEAAEPRVLASRANAIVHLAPAPVVARVATTAAVLRPPQAALQRELGLARFLAGAGIPAVRPSGELDPGPHAHDGLWLCFTEHVAEDPGRPPEAAEVGRMLADLHAALKRYDEPLPALGPVRADLGRMLDAVEADGLLAGEDVAVLRGEHARLAPLLAATTEHPEAQALHGDPHLGNLLRTAGGGLIWNDLEDACRGPVAWDVAVLAGSAGAFGAPAALAAYGPHPSEAALEPFFEARRLQAAGWLAILSRREPELRQRAQAVVTEIRDRR
jgi:Ser/Thr protein kinase RdoA (MazF antagonist)